MSSQLNSSPVVIQTWLIDELSKLTGQPCESIALTGHFQSQGVTSIGLATLTTRLQEWLRIPLPVTLLFEHPTVASLARHLAGVASGGPDAQARAALDTRAGSEPIAREPIAIIGIACRFPGGATSPAAYWRLLVEGFDAVRELPPSRMETARHYDPDPAAPGKMSSRWAALLDEVGHFDPRFFGISPREARQLDPQQRLMLELSWEALEDAGLPPPSLVGSRTGVFCGAIWQDYAGLQGQALERITQHTGAGQALGMIANRVSYNLGLQGPSLTLDTGCSASLMAVHLACQSLRGGESSLALAGGVNVILSPRTMVALTKFGGLSPDGRCKAFDASANGFVRGEGGGLVVLKPLSRALADGNPIHCVILGSATNNDGASNGLTAPNPRAQRAVLAEACADAGVAPARIHYVEAHGTGTALGDPIEADALGQIMGVGRAPETPLLIGSVKTNLGHLEGAAGIAGLIKVALALRHRALPASLHFERPNPRIPFDALKLRVVGATRPWPHPEEPALAGVSSFGWGGTNCHVVLGGLSPAAPRLLQLSASSPEALRALARERQAGLAGVALSSERESAGSQRLAIAFRSQEELSQGLQGFLAGASPPAPGADHASSERPRLAFVFSPQGGQWWGMGRQLLAEEPSFRATLERYDRALRQHVDWSVIDLLSRSREPALLAREEVLQPILFCLQVALAELWRARGLEPDTVVGHSLGEIAAAHVAGLLDVEDAVRVVHHFSRLQSTTAGTGGMALVGLPEPELRSWLERLGSALELAAFNGPAATVVSGPPHALDELQAALAPQGVFCSRIQVNVAAHSALMDPLLKELARALSGIRVRPGRIPMMSGMEARVLESGGGDASYWPRLLRAPVRFNQCIDALHESGHRLFVELSPHPVLGRAIEQCLAHRRGPSRVLAAMIQGEDARLTLLRGVGAACTEGFALREVRDSPPEPGLLVVSARDPEALRAQAAQTARHLEQHPELSAADVCFTAATARAHLEHRLAIVGSSMRELGEQLDAFASGAPASSAPATGAVSGAAPAAPPRIAFIFTGQGAQYAGMGRELHRTQPGFRRALERCESVLQPHLDRPLLELLFSGDDTLLSRTGYAQPALFSLEYALAALLDAWGIRPDAVLGHSVGELVAACVAGVFPLEDALPLVALRGRLMQALPGGGAMVAVKAPPDALLPWLSGFDAVSLAAVNGPGDSVLSGDERQLRALLQRAGLAEGRCHWLRVSHAFHSPLMEPMLEELERAVSRLRLEAPRLPLVSNLSGAHGGEELLTAAYWRRHAREPVRFSEGLATLERSGIDVYLELGPHPALAPMGAATLPGASTRWLHCLRRGREDARELLAALARLHVLGAPIDWEAVHASGSPRRVPLPTYPFQRQRYWLEGESRDAAPHDSPVLRLLEAGDVPGLAQRLEGAGGLSREQRQALPGILDALVRAHRAPAEPRLPPLYRLRWRRVEDEAPAEAAGTWLLLADAGGDASRLAEAIHARGGRCILASRGPALRRVGERAFEVDPLRPEQLDGLVEAVRTTGAEPRGVVHLWALDAPAPDGLSAEELLQRCAGLCGGALHAIQALARAGFSRPARLWLVTRGAVAVLGAPSPSGLLQAPLWGLGKVISLEQPRLWGGLVDLDPGAEDGGGALAATLLGAGGEDQLALRGGARYAARLVEEAAPEQAAPALSSEATYLVTGGLGNLGLEVARWLVRRGARQLVLAGRAGMPPREAWQPGDPRARALEELERAGATVRAEALDVSVSGALEALLLRLASEGAPPLRGVLHAAGIIEHRPLEQLRVEDFERVLRPKLAGGWELQRLAEARGLDFLVLFSSVGSVWSARGQGHYAAANHFLDTLAHHGRARGVPVLSVNWGLFARSGGDAEHDWLLRAGMRALDPGAGFERMGQLLGGAEAQVTIASVDWPRLREVYEASRPRRLLSELGAPPDAEAAPGSGVTSFRSELDALTEAARPARLRLHVRDAVARILDLAPGALDEVADRGFFDLGVDSLMAVELRRQLERDLGLTVSPTLLFDHPTLAELSAHLAQSLWSPGRPAPPEDALVAELAAELAALEKRQRR